MTTSDSNQFPSHAPSDQNSSSKEEKQESLQPARSAGQKSKTSEKWQECTDPTLTPAPFRWRRLWPGLALMGAGAFWIVFLADILNPDAYEFLKENLPDNFVVTTRQMGNTVVLATIALIVWFLDPRHRPALLPLLVMLLIVGSVNGVVKHVAGRARPEFSYKMGEEEREVMREWMAENPKIAFSLERGDQWFPIGTPRPTEAPWLPFVADGEFISFPSGHSTAAFALATWLSHVYPPLKIYWYVLSTGCASSRVADRRHHPGDALFGAGLGYLLGQLLLGQAWLWRLGWRIPPGRRRTSAR